MTTRLRERKHPESLPLRREPRLSHLSVFAQPLGEGPGFELLLQEMDQRWKQVGEPLGGKPCDGFGTALAHDFRGLLAYLQGALDYLSSKPGRNRTQQRMVKDIAAKTGQLSHAVAALGDFFKPRRLAPTLGCLQDTIDKAIDGFQDTCERSHIWIVRSGPDRRVILAADHDLIGRALSGLLSEGIDTMPSGGEIRVDLEREARWARIRISHPIDNLSTRLRGIGMLGIMVATRWIELHGGWLRISAPSEHREGLVTFTVGLPAHHA